MIELVLSTPHNSPHGIVWVDKSSAVVWDRRKKNHTAWCVEEHVDRMYFKTGSIQRYIPALRAKGDDGWCSFITGRGYLIRHETLRATLDVLPEKFSDMVTFEAMWSRWLEILGHGKP